MEEKFHMAMNVFLPEKKEVDLYPLHKLIDIIKEDGLYESEKDMAISSVDHIRRNFVYNYERYTKLYDMFLKTFNASTTINIPVIFNDEIKTLEFLTFLSIPQKALKEYKKYITARETLENIKTRFDTTSVDEDDMQAVLNNKLILLENMLVIKKQEFRIKAAFLDFKEIFITSKVYPQLQSFMLKDRLIYQEQITTINEKTDKVIYDIEDDHLMIQDIENLYKELEKCNI